MPDQVLTTKLYMPVLRSGIVPRPRLVEKLNCGIQGPLTLISAPPGFGKTTLVSEWRASRSADEFPLSWLSLDAEDNNTTRFLSYIISAIGVIRQDFGEIALSALQSPQPIPVQAILTNLINEIGRIEGPFVLVLDDYHVIQTQPIHDALSFILDHLPSQLHLVILSRADPPLPLARLRARSQLTEIRENDLRFTHDETTAFLNQVMELNLSTKDLAALEQRTEGWITGLQLAALSLHGHENPSHFIATFGGGYHFIVDYLVEEVLNRQSDSTREFLLRTSILNRLTGSLCDALTGRTDGQATLEYLEKANLFVTPIGNECCWYRYHQLFADVMQNRLRQSYPSQIFGLHIRAAEWFEYNGHLSDAVKHALVAGDENYAARLVDENAWSMIMRGELALLINWVKAVGKAAYTLPRLCIYQAWALDLTGQIENVENWLQRGEEYLTGNPSFDPQKGNAIEGSAAAIRAHIALLQNDAPRAIQLCEQAERKLEADNLTMRSGVAFLLGNARLIGGDLANVDSAWAEAVRLGRMSGSLLVATTALDGMTYLATMRGELHKAASLCREELQLSAAPHHQPTPLAAYAYSRLGSLHHEWNDIATALHYAEKGAELSRILARPNYIIQSHTVLARLRLAQHDLNSALDLLHEAEQVARQYALTLFADSLFAEMRMRVWTAKEDLEAGVQLAKERGLEVGKNFNHMRESEYLMLVRILLARGKLREALALQKHILRAFASFGWQGRVIETLVLRAMILQAEDNIPESLNALEKALSLAEPEGYVRVFLDEGEPMAGLLRRAGSRGIAPKYVSRLLGEFDKMAGKASASHQPLIEPLSDRELEVLALLADGLSNQKIAERLVLSIGTVKTHTSSIYRKLDVSSRTQAIARAKELSLL